MLFSWFLSCTALICCYASVGIARTRGMQSGDLSVSNNSSVGKVGRSFDWEGGSVNRRPVARRKKSDRRPRHRHSTRVDRNRPAIVLLPPWKGDSFDLGRVPVTSTTTTSTTASPFIINVPYDESVFQNETRFDVQVPADYLAPPLVDSISQFQLAPDREPELSTAESTSQNPETTYSTAQVYTSTVPTTLVTLSVLLENEPVPVNDNCTSETPCHNLELTYYTFTPKEDNTLQTPTPAFPENDLSPPLITAESGDIRNIRYLQQQHYRENYSTSNAANETPRKKDPRQHKHSRHACTQKGYVADVSSGCQVFHICVDKGVGESMACPNGTLFNQDFSVCDWWYNVDCK